MSSSLMSISRPQLLLIIQYLPPLEKPYLFMACMELHWEHIQIKLVNLYSKHQWYQAKICKIWNEKNLSNWSGNHWDLTIFFVNKYKSCSLCRSWIAVIARYGGCTFEDKVRNAMNANFSGAIIYNVDSNKVLNQVMLNPKNKMSILLKNFCKTCWEIR